MGEITEPGEQHSHAAPLRVYSSTVLISHLSHEQVYGNTVNDNIHTHTHTDMYAHTAQSPTQTHKPFLLTSLLNKHPCEILIMLAGNLVSIGEYKNNLVRL